jgi:2-dehydro-3-deoxyphosphogluconate aldolase/(4S)-4-hydroxy-2-oxoglutarate aldolase
MTPLSNLDRLAEIGVLPVVVIDDETRALPLALALSDGGVLCAEITLRTPAALASLRAMAEAPNFLVGCGTVLSAEQVDLAVDAGAGFIVSPGFDDTVAARARDRGVPYIPGVGTATEVMRARSSGLVVQKLFPAAQLGGAAAVAALAGPFSDVTFVPSGGVTLADVASYRLNAVHAVSTSWIAPRHDIAAGNFDAISHRAQEFTSAVKS